MTTRGMVESARRQGVRTAPVPSDWAQLLMYSWACARMAFSCVGACSAASTRNEYVSVSLFAALNWLRPHGG